MIIVKCDRCGKEEPRELDVFTRVNFYNYKENEEDNLSDDSCSYGNFLDMHFCPECGKRVLHYLVDFCRFSQGYVDGKTENLLGSDG